MKAKMKISIFILVSLLLFPTHLCKASFFEMNLKQASIYTPGKINLTMKPTDSAKIDNDYKFRVSIFLTGTLIREQTIAANREKPVGFELDVQKRITCLGTFKFSTEQRDAVDASYSWKIIFSKHRNRRCFYGPQSNLKKLKP